MSTQLKLEGETTMSELKSTAPKDFDREYMDAQVDAHQKVLSALDEKLIPSARDPELKTLLNEMRTTVESHLKDAKKIQGSLGAASEKD
jgi:putative membrane protein